tara:strand:- start:522 stop:992 length:471 start_codon:yes stop_codon:yes gene_type:complete
MKPKIPAVKVLSDECAINVGQVIEDGEITNPGTPHYVHEGEWVEVLPVMSVKEVMNISRLQSSVTDSSKLDENLTNICKELCRRVVAWNWTNLMGEPMEQPYNRPDILEELSSEELMWLMSATGAGESADARKKGSKKSETTSLVMEDSQALLPSE